MSLLIVFAGAGGIAPDPGTLGFAALPATLSLGVQNTPPAATETLGFASLPATLAFGVLNVNPETLGVVSFPATVAFGVQNTPPPSTETLGFASFPATLTFGVVAANNAGSFSIIAQPAVLSFGVQQSLGGTLGFVSLPATLGFNVTNTGGSGPAPYSPPIPTPYRDDDAYDAIIALLLATNEFDGVVRSTDPDLARVTAEEARVIILDPGVGGSTAAQPSPYRLLRQPTYTLTIKVRAEEFEDSRAELDRLYAVVENTLLYQSYGGFTIPRLSTLYQDRYANAAHPEAQIQLRGQFGYIRVLPGGGFRTTY